MAQQRLGLGEEPDLLGRGLAGIGRGGLTDFQKGALPNLQTLFTSLAERGFISQSGAIRQEMGRFLSEPGGLQTLERELALATKGQNLSLDQFQQLNRLTKTLVAIDSTNSNHLLNLLKSQVQETKFVKKHHYHNEICA